VLLREVNLSMTPNVTGVLHENQQKAYFSGIKSGFRLTRDNKLQEESFLANISTGVV
jgi:hypothetical protein